MDEQQKDIIRNMVASLQKEINEKRKEMKKLEYQVERMKMERDGLQKVLILKKDQKEEKVDDDELAMKEIEEAAQATGQPQ